MSLLTGNGRKHFDKIRQGLGRAKGPAATGGHAPEQVIPLEEDNFKDL